MATATELPPAPAPTAPAPLPTPHAERDALAGLMLALQPGHAFAFTGADWGLYTHLRNVREDHRRRAVSITYHRGRLEFVSHSLLHERWKVILGRLLETLAEELGVPLFGCGNATLEREDLDSGFEPDEWYYLGPTAVRAAAAGVRRKLDFPTDPPPDLAIEIDVSRTVDSRLALYTALGIPEVWRFDGDELRVQRLGTNRLYEPVAASAFFPAVPVVEVVRFLRLAETTDDSAVVREFRAWVRQLPPPAGG